MNNIKWIFFDIGSTLVDESRAYEHRIKDTIYGSDITYERFYNKIIDFAKQGKNGYMEAVSYYGLSQTLWHSEDEFLYPGAEKCLKLLSTKYRIGIIANQISGMKDRLDKMGIGKYIDLVISSAEEGISKPDIKIFKTALDRAMCHAEHAVMVGDRIDNDIIPAKIIGMHTIWIKQGYGGMALPKNEKEKADYVIYSLDEICNLFPD